MNLYTYNIPAEPDSNELTPDDVYMDGLRALAKIYARIQWEIGHEVTESLVADLAVAAANVSKSLEVIIG